MDKPGGWCLISSDFMGGVFGGCLKCLSIFKLRTDDPDPSAPHRQICVAIHDEAQEELHRPGQDRSADDAGDGRC